MMQIKNEVALEMGYDSWLSMIDWYESSNTRTNAIILICAAFDRVLSKMKAKSDELTRWKESALKVLNNLDLQELAKELGIGLGEDIPSQVLPKVKELKVRMFTEGQVREAMYDAYVNGPGRDNWAEYEDDIINQLKAK